MKALKMKIAKPFVCADPLPLPPPPAKINFTFRTGHYAD